MSDLSDRKDVDRNAPLRLHVAARLAFPDGTITASDLRKEARRGSLIIEKIADKEFTTLNSIEKMRDLCRSRAKDVDARVDRSKYRHARGTSGGPRLVVRHEAATYCCLSSSAFSNWVRLGKLPPALPGTSRWDLKAIDLALDTWSGLSAFKIAETESTALDEWRAARARRSEGNT
ncbi:hypothetical protein [Bradyrhizobium sp. WSM4349]|uniref:hypothetical protein n=1 Tax=Bradyrhizobium sp. WSM4349 TaxID=1040988 RepID=UPI0012F8579D|nr:hypothetical protein [Bradyrhizobium sp. WSM4349]